MKYGVIYEFSKFGRGIQSLSTYCKFENSPIEGNKELLESKEVVKVLFLFDSEQEREAFDKKIILPKWTYTMNLAKRKLEKIYNQFQ